VEAAARRHHRQADERTPTAREPPAPVVAQRLPQAVLVDEIVEAGRVEAQARVDEQKAAIGLQQQVGLGEVELLGTRQPPGFRVIERPEQRAEPGRSLLAGHRLLEQVLEWCAAHPGADERHAVVIRGDERGREARLRAPPDRLKGGGLLPQARAMPRARVRHFDDEVLPSTDLRRGPHADDRQPIPPIGPKQRVARCVSAALRAALAGGWGLSPSCHLRLRRARAKGRA
jgi:hypothetical protein